MKIAILNCSSVSDADMVTLTLACQLYADDVGRAHNRYRTQVRYLPGVKIAPAGWRAMVAFDDPDIPDALGYHDVDPRGIAYGRAFYRMIPNGVVLHDPSGQGASLAGVLTHEIAEMIGDELANQWVMGPLLDTVTGRLWNLTAEELCDAVQEQAYTITVGGVEVDASNFLWPRWFARGSTGERYDQMRLLTAPLTIAPGGYAIVADMSPESQIFGDREAIMGTTHRGMIARPTIARVDAARPQAPWRAAAKSFPGGRTKLRLANEVVL